jgi:transposase
MTLITGVERRRRWSEEDRTRILAAIAEAGAVVADVARREDVCTSLVYKWRRAAQREKGAATCEFSPLIIEATPAGPATLAQAPDDLSAVVEVELKNARVKIGAGAPSAVIAATLKALRA